MYGRPIVCYIKRYTMEITVGFVNPSFWCALQYRIYFRDASIRPVSTQ